MCLLFASVSVCLLAVPVLRVRRSVTLDDGRSVMVTTYGDEDFSYLLTDGGQVVVMQDGTYHDTGLSAEEYAATLPSQPLRARQRVGSVASALIKPQGVKKIPVILVAFKDKGFTIASSDKRVKDFYDTFFNGEDITEATGNWGSVREYFTEQSLGQFMPEFSIIGPVQLDNGYGYYGGDRGNVKDTLYSEFIRESFTKAQAQQNDWTEFDNDGNGSIDMCVFIFAGMGQNYTNSYGDKNTIWPKEMPASYTVNGITISGCTSSCELHPVKAEGGVITETQADGVGVIIHEISHALGLPDLYDTNNKAFGMDFWSIMDYGMYTRNSLAPVGYTAYEREFLGWQQTETIDSPRTLHIDCFDRGGKGYKIINNENPNEYYILDNRQAEGWDWGVCSNRGHGMLVMHVDYNSSTWTSNRVNTDPAHQRMTIIPANGTLIGSNNAPSQATWQASLAGNPYPGTTGNHELTDSSDPASLVFTGGYMGKPLVDIEESEEGTITVKVMPIGTLEAPAGLTFEDTRPGRTTATWEAAENAELYNVRLYCEGELVQQHDSIAATSLVLDGLRTDADYCYSVQAINDCYRNSPWTESIAFRATPDAISETTASAELIRVYDMDGRMVSECFADELSRLSLRHGIYIIRRQNGTTKKVMI